MNNLKLDCPIYSALIDYANNTHISFHTPGHKSSVLEGDFSNIYKYDATELSVTDELYSPKSCIAEAEEKATLLFSSFHTFYSAGGASQCVKAALAEFVGKKVVFDRNIHTSVVAAIAFYGIEAIFVSKKAVSELYAPPSVSDIQEVLDKNLNVSAVFLTSPNYWGISADCFSIRKLCDDYGITLVVDNSHGTHFRFCSNMCDSVYDSHNAHVVIDSAHKTLPVMTGGALLHYNRKVDLAVVRRRMMSAGSTSPSFPILASLDVGISWCSVYGTQMYDSCLAKVENLRRRLKNKGFFILEGDFSDPLRLSVYLGRESKNAVSLFERNGVYPEVELGGFVIFIITPFNKESDIVLLERLFDCIAPIRFYDSQVEELPVPERKLSIRDAFFSERSTVDLLHSVGRVSADMIVFHHPPCVPLCFPGEVISESLVDILKNNGCESVEVVL